MILDRQPWGPPQVSGTYGSSRVLSACAAQKGDGHRMVVRSARGWWVFAQNLTSGGQLRRSGPQAG